MSALCCSEKKNKISDSKYNKILIYILNENYYSK